MPKKEPPAPMPGLTKEQTQGAVEIADVGQLPMKVYVAGPYTVPHPQQNTERAMGVMLQLIHRGHFPFCPHLSHFPDQMARRMGRPVSWEAWMEQDMVWLACCDALLRIPGVSKGADLEVAEAQRLGIPIYTDVNDVPIVKHLVAPEAKVYRADAAPRSLDVPRRTHCKACGLQLSEKAPTVANALEAPCPGCTGLDYDKCPDCKGKLFHPGCSRALEDLGYDRVCVPCARTFVWGDPRCYGNRRS